MRKMILPIAFVLLAVVLLGGCECRNKGHLSGDTPFSGSDVSAAQNKLPDFILTGVQDDREIGSADFEGRIVLVAFVSSWCSQCREEMNDLQKLQVVMPSSDFAVLGMVVAEDDRGEIRVIMEKGKFTFPMVVADEAIKKSFGDISDVPVAFLVDRDGMIRRKYLNHLDMKVVEKDIDELMFASVFNGDGDCVIGDCKNGEGTFQYHNGKKYTGGWKNGLENGQGRMSLPDGTYYEGEYQSGLPHGRGTYSIADGRKYVGEWKHGLPHGQGIETQDVGVSYEGQWFEGKPHGKGVVRKDGKVDQEGYWVMGQYVGKDIHD